VAKLTAAEKEQHRNWLSEWRSPVDIAAYESAVNDSMGSADFFRQAGVEFLRDAWLAGEFGRHRKSTSVRLVPDREQWPDFEAMTDNIVERVECVEADIPGRRRGDEYQIAEQQAANGEPTVKDDPIENWIARADQVATALASAIGTKVGKCYAGRSSLLVYLNIGEFGIRQTEIEALMEPTVAPALPHFHRVWILWKDRLYGPWPDDLQ
jgi:hypothetical protein